MNPRILPGLAIVAAAIFAVATTANAQDNIAQQTVVQANPTTTSDVRLETEETQWIPHSITVIESRELDQAYRPDLEHLESLVPGLIVDRMNTTPRGAAIALRGFDSAQPEKGFFPAVAVNVDGVYIGNHTGRLAMLFDFEKVEVTRSPSVFEANPNLSGTINLERARPGKEFETDVRVSAGTHGRQEASGSITVPLGDSFSTSLSAFWKDKGGQYMKNIFSGRDENNEDYAFASWRFAADFGDSIELTYTYDVEDSNEASPALLNISSTEELLCASTINTFFPNCRRGVGNPELDSLVTTTQNWGNYRTFDGDYHTLKLTFDFMGHEFTSITGYRETEEDFDQDLDASFSDFYHIRQNQDYKQLSQEITFTGEWSERLTYAGGIYYLKSEFDLFQQEYEILEQMGIAGIAQGLPPGSIQELISSQESELLSVFAHVEYVLNDQWKADLGIRLTEVDRDFTHSPSRIRLGDDLSPLRTLLIAEDTSKEPLISAGLTYKVDSEAMIYIRYTEGFLPGGFDENAMSAITADSYGEQKSRTAEVGLKSDWWDERLRVNFVYFNSQLDDKLERFDSYTFDNTIESFLDNISDAEVAGWELEIEAVPMDNLTIRTALAHYNADYTAYKIPDIANPGEFIGLAGLEPERAPKENLFVSAHYSLPLGPGVMHAYAGYRLLSDYQTNSTIREADVKNWSATDLSLSYEWQDWTFRLFSNNVKNKEFIQNVRLVKQTDIVPVDAALGTVPTLARYAEYRQPRYTGLEIIYRPTF